MRERADGEAVDPTESELNMWINDAEKIQEFRLRLSDLSWLMAGLAQRIATRAIVTGAGENIAAHKLLRVSHL